MRNIYKWFLFLSLYNLGVLYMAKYTFAAYVLDRIKGNADLYNKVLLVLKSTGQLPIVEEDYEHVVRQLREDHQTLIRRFGSEHADLTAKFIAAIPEYRARFQDAKNLYRIFLEVGNPGTQVTKVGSSTGKEYPKNSEKGNIFSLRLEELIRGAPREIFTSDEIMFEDVRNVLVRYAMRETLPTLEKDAATALETIEERIKIETSPNLQEAHRVVARNYKAYLSFEIPDANPKFRDPQTGATGVLPSLHQRIGIYHILQEKRFGIFDDCGTGKTAQAALAGAMMSDRLTDLGKKAYHRTVVLCNNPAKEAWKKGLAGDEDVCYFREKKRTFIVNGNLRDEDLEAAIRDADFIILNYERLASKVRYKGKKQTVAEVLAAIGFDTLILDEAHNIKNTSENAVYSKAAQYLALQRDADGEFKPLILLSGTPIPDSMADYSMLGHLLEPERYPTPEAFDAEYQQDPRSISTVMLRKTLRRKSEDVMVMQAIDRQYVPVALGDVQRIVYENIIGNTQKYRHWLTQARKALLDPRLVDPEILQDLRLLGQLTYEDAAKYKELEDTVVAAVRSGEKTVIFSSLFMEGVTSPPTSIRERYVEIGKLDAYEKLGFEAADGTPRLLRERLEERLEKEFGRKYSIGVIDGGVNPREEHGDVSERDKVLRAFKENPDYVAVLCTTKTGGEGLDMTAASWGIYLDEDYSPATMEQGDARLQRKGQKKEVHIRNLSGEETLDEAIRQYVQKKRLLIRMAVDGYPLTEEEKQLIEERLQIKEIEKRMGGKSRDLSQVEYIANMIETEVKSKRARGTREAVNNGYDTTKAQLLRRLIAPFINQGVGWNDPKLVELYASSVQELSVYALHRARVLYLVEQAKQGVLTFPSRILAEGSGPSLLYHACRDLEKIVKAEGFAVPEIWDRDLAPNMLAVGGNPNQVVGDMRGRGSTLEQGSFDFVDHESISLLRYMGDMKEAILETNRVLRPEGYVLFGAKDIRFANSFYAGLEQAGFLVLSEKGIALTPTKAFMQQVEENLGSEYADAYRNKLSGSYFILAQKFSSPASALDEKLFVLERPYTEVGGVERRAKDSQREGRSEKSDEPERYTFFGVSEREFWVDGAGAINISTKPERSYVKPKGGRLYYVDKDGIVQFQREPK